MVWCPPPQVWLLQVASYREPGRCSVPESVRHASPVPRVRPIDRPNDRKKRSSDREDVGLAGMRPQLGPLDVEVTEFDAAVLALPADVPLRAQDAGVFLHCFRVV